MLRPGSLPFILLLGFIFASGSLGIDLYVPSQPSIAADLNSSAFAAQLTLSVFFAGYAIAQLFFGPLSDRFGRKPVIIGGLGLFAVSSLACSIASSIEILIGLRFVQGLAAAAGTVAARAVARDYFEGKDLGRVFSYLSLTLSISAALLPPLGGYLTIWFGWEANFVFLALLGTLMMLATYFFLAESLSEPNPRALEVAELFGRFGQLLRHPVFVGYMLAGGSCFVGMFAFLTNSSFVFVDVLDVPTEKFGLYLGIVSAGYMVGTFAGGQLVGRFGGDKLLVFGAQLCLVGGILIALVSWLGIASVPTIAVPMILYMFGAGFVFPQSLAGALGPFPQMAGTASAMMGFVVMMVSSLISAIVGRLYDGTSAPMSLTIALMSVLTITAYVFIVRRNVLEVSATD